MPAKRSAFQRERDLVEIERMRLHRKSTWEIAASIGPGRAIPRPYTLSAQTICNDLELIAKRWREAASVDRGEAVARELAAIDDNEREFREAWERSKESSQRTRTSGKAGGGPGTAEVVREQRDGNPEFLKGVERAGIERRKLLGLDEAVEATITHQGSVVVAVQTVDQWREERQRRISNAHVTLHALPPAPPAEEGSNGAHGAG